MIFHQFSYRNDSRKSVASIRSIRRLYPTAPIYLWSDAANPVDPSIDYGDGVHVRQTTFMRMQNLNGPECVIGIQKCYATGYEENPGETHHIKLDPDSMILSTSKIDELLAKDAYFFCPGTTDTAIYGWFQFHSRAFHDDYQQVKCIRRFSRQPSFGEDVVFNQAATDLANGRPVLHSQDHFVPGECRPHWCPDEPYSNSFESSAVLIYLSRNPNLRQVSIEQMMDEFWPEFLASQPQ